jgi:hypothetical protein
MALLACETLSAQNSTSTGNPNQTAAAPVAGSSQSSKASGSQAAPLRRSSTTRRHRSGSKAGGPPAPSQLPASPPQISYVDGQLTVVANNSTLSDVLKGIQSTTGAKVEGVTPTDTDRIFGEFGPASPHEVCDKLLNGSHYDFILMGAPQNPNSVQRIILTERSTETTTPPPAAAPHPATAEESGDSLDMNASEAAADNGSVETQNQPATTEQQQIIPPPADSTESQPAADGQTPAPAPAHPQHWGVNDRRPGQQPPQPTDVQPH